MIIDYELVEMTLPDTEILHRIIVLSTLLYLRDQVVRTEPVTQGPVHLPGLLVHLCGAPERVVRVERAVLKPNSVVEERNLEGD